MFGGISNKIFENAQVFLPSYHKAGFTFYTERRRTKGKARKGALITRGKAGMDPNKTTVNKTRTSPMYFLNNLAIDVPVVFMAR